MISGVSDPESVCGEAGAAVCGELMLAGTTARVVAVTRGADACVSNTCAAWAIVFAGVAPEIASAAWPTAAVCTEALSTGAGSLIGGAGSTAEGTGVNTLRDSGSGSFARPADMNRKTETATISIERAVTPTARMVNRPLLLEKKRSFLISLSVKGRRERKAVIDRREPFWSLD